MDDAVSIEVIHGGHDAVLEFLFGCDADLAQHRAGELGEEAFDKIEPRAVLWGEDEFESTGRLLGEPSLGLLGDVRRMIVEDQLDRCMGRIGGVDKLEKFDEFAAAMAILDEGMNLTGQQETIATASLGSCLAAAAVSLISFTSRETHRTSAIFCLNSGSRRSR